ncbi:unnamed protein product, partial [Rotaria sordida]
HTNQVRPFNDENLTGKTRHCKITLKEVLTLLVGSTIPVAIGIYTAVTNEQLQKSAQRAENKQHSIATERRAFDLEQAFELYQQQLYKNFLDAMYILHRDGELNDSAEPWAFANARYRAAQREFDPIRNAQALIFLKEKQLIGREKCSTKCQSKLVKDIIRLNGLNFDNLNLSSETGNLSRLDLSCVEFEQISMINTVFFYTNLNGVIFSNSRMTGAKFQGSSLSCSQFINTELHGANFYDSNLNDTIFNNVDLSTVTLSQKQMQVAHFANAILPNGTKITSTTMITSTTTEKITAATSNETTATPTQAASKTTTEAITTNITRDNKITRSFIVFKCVF